MKPLSPKQRRALLALADGATNRQAAQQAGVSERSIQRWRSAPAFAEALRTAEGDRLSDVARQLTALSLTAAATLAEILDDKTLPVFARLRAAQLVLEHGQRLHDMRLFAARLDALEAIATRGNYGEQ
jgi:hypothetical protein